MSFYNTEEKFEKARKILDKKYDDKRVVIPWHGEEHYTPCDILFSFDERVAELKKDFAETMKMIRDNDKTKYSYYGKVALREYGTPDVPKKGQRWLTPKEIADNWLRENEMLGL